MTEHDKADQARKGLVDSVKGKAKEVVGAITGNDSLTAEGQLEQTQARDRKDANSVEAVADAEAEQARTEAAEAREEGARERAAVNAEATGRGDNVAQRPGRAEARSRAGCATRRRAERRRARNSTHSSRCSRRRTRSAKRSTPQTEEAVDAAAEHQSSVQAATVPRQRPTASDDRPTN